MAEKDKGTPIETTTVDPGQYQEPREATDPDHKDAGQEYVEREENQTARETRVEDS